MLRSHLRLAGALLATSCAIACGSSRSSPTDAGATDTGHVGTSTGSGSGTGRPKDGGSVDGHSGSGSGGTRDGGTAVSPSCTTVPPASRIVDSAGDVWTLVSSDGGGDRVARDGVVDTTTHEVILLLYYDGVLYQENVNLDWWGWVGGTWSAVQGDPRAGHGCGAHDAGRDGATDSGVATIAVPAQAAAAGFHTLVFNQGGSAGWNVDFNATGDPGYAWYQSGSFYGSGGGNPSVSDGVLTITAQGITSATSASNAQGYVGYAFGDGYYAEAAISIDTSCVSTAHVWPAFWSNPVEAEIQPGTTDHWPGQATGYCHYAELDYMEFWGSPMYATNYLLDWYNVYGACNGSFCSCGTNGGCAGVPDNGDVSTAASFPGGDPSTLDWASFNIYGALVVPSQVHGGGTGYYQGYFNNAATSSYLAWNAYSASVAPPPVEPNILSTVDIQHFYFILSTTSGCPLKFSYVRVWQAP